MAKSAKIQGDYALYVYGNMSWSVGELGEVLSNVLPIVNRMPVLTEWDILFNNAFQDRTIIIIDDVAQSNHKCDCGNCEDCEGHFQELLHRCY